MDSKGIIAVLIFTTTVQLGQTALLQSCTDDDFCKADGGDPNAVCSTDQTSGNDSSGNCICTGEFKAENDACVPKGLGDDCDATTDCQEVDNAECDSTCRCANGYTTSNGACAKVHGSACSGSEACPGLDNSVCDGSNCACAPGFGLKDNVCVKTVSGTACPNGDECDAIEHASCDETSTPAACKCGDGYTESVDECKLDSGAASMKAIIWMVYSSALVFLVQRVI